MKKMIAVFVLIISIFMLSGCASSFTCSICGEQKTGKPYRGEQWVYCGECYNTFSRLFGK